MNEVQAIILMSQLLAEKRYDEAAEAAGRERLAFEQLEHMLRQTQGATCYHAALALIKTGTRAVPPLVAALRDRQYPVRQAAALALGDVGDHRAVPSLVAALQDEQMAVRQAAAASLSKLPDRQATLPLLIALYDADSRVRRMAAIALGKIGDPRALADLERVAAEGGELGTLAAEAQSKIKARAGAAGRREG